MLYQALFQNQHHLPQGYNHRGDRHRGRTQIFRYLNPIPTKGGRFCPPLQRSQLKIVHGYAPVPYYLRFDLCHILGICRQKIWNTDHLGPKWVAKCATISGWYLIENCYSGNFKRKHVSRHQSMFKLTLLMSVHSTRKINMKYLFYYFQWFQLKF